MSETRGERQLSNPIGEALEELEAKARQLGARDFHAWVGTENYEMRVAPDGSWVDRRILTILREA